MRLDVSLSNSISASSLIGRCITLRRSYASQIDDYSGEKFVVDPQTVPETRGGGEIVKTRLQQSSGRTVVINYLVRGGKVIDVYLNGTISDLATRRDEFASLIAAGGADGLVKRLHERTQTLLSR
jgi:phospholipid transport system substrate-binding protein